MSRTRLAALAGALIVAAGLGTGLGVGLSGSSGQSPTATAQLTSVRSGCEQWLESAPAQSGTSQLCRDMTDWMSQYMLRDGAEPQMMWGNPSRLASTCQQWTTEKPAMGITDSRKLVQVDGGVDVSIPH